jgi:hypothetical protein
LKIAFYILNSNEESSLIPIPPKYVGLCSTI